MANMITFRNETNSYITSITQEQSITVAEDIYYIRYNYSTTVDVPITLDFTQTQMEIGSSKTSFVEHQEQNITLPLAEGEYAYSYDEITNIVSTNSVKATALKKGDE